MDPEITSLLSYLEGYAPKEFLGTYLGAHEVVVTHGNDERLVRAFPLLNFRSPQEKANLLKEIKSAEHLSNQPFFVKQIEHLYTKNHLVVIYDNYATFKMEKFASSIDFVHNLPLLMKDMVDALCHLRDRKIVHTNITSKMIVFMNGYFKLCPFTFCDSLGAPFTLPPTLYSAPESHTRKIFLSQSQIFSLGVICYKLLCGSFPLQNEKPEHLKEVYSLKKKLDLVFPRSADARLCELIQGCLEVDYQARIPLRTLKEAVDKLAKDTFQNVIAHRKVLLHKIKDINAKIQKNEHRGRNFEARRSSSLKPALQPDLSPDITPAPLSHFRSSKIIQL